MGDKANKASQEIKGKIRIIAITNSTISRMSSFTGVSIRCTNATMYRQHSRRSYGSWPSTRLRLKQVNEKGKQSKKVGNAICMNKFSFETSVINNNVAEYIYHYNTIASSSISRKSRFAQTTIRAPCVLTVSIYVAQGFRCVTFISV